MCCNLLCSDRTQLLIIACAAICYVLTAANCLKAVVCRARLATDASQKYPLAIKHMACKSLQEHKTVKHEADLMHAMHRAGLVCIPRPYDLHWLKDEGKAFLVME